MADGEGARSTTTALGRLAEDLAAGYLEQLGYRVVARNFRGDRGEVDLVAWEGGVLCFVEVRSRKSSEYGEPLETIDQRKIQRVVRAARAYVGSLTGPWPEMRFDAVGIVMTEPPQITLVRCAFEAH